MGVTFVKTAKEAEFSKRTNAGVDRVQGKILKGIQHKTPLWSARNTLLVDLLSLICEYHSFHLDK